MALLQGKYTQISARETFREIDSSLEGPRNIISFGRVARELVQLETSPEGFRTFEGDRLLVASHVHGFITADRRLDQLGKGPAVAQARSEQLDKVIEFNHAVRQLIDNDRRIGLGDLVRFAGETYAITHPSEFASNSDKADAKQRFTDISRRTERVLRGMRGELTVQQTLGMYYEVDDDVTVDEEKRGVDMWVNIAPKGEEEYWVQVDAKTSQRAAEDARSRQPRGREEVILAATTQDADYAHGGFYLKPEVARRLAPEMKGQFERELVRAGHR